MQDHRRWIADEAIEVVARLEMEPSQRGYDVVVEADHSLTNRAVFWGRCGDAWEGFEDLDIVAVNVDGRWYFSDEYSDLIAGRWPTLHGRDLRAVFRSRRQRGWERRSRMASADFWDCGDAVGYANWQLGPLVCERAAVHRAGPVPRAEWLLTPTGPHRTALFVCDGCQQHLTGRSQRGGVHARWDEIRQRWRAPFDAPPQALRHPQEENPEIARRRAFRQAIVELTPAQRASMSVEDFDRLWDGP